MSETNKYLHLTRPYLKGNGVDIGSGGWPVVPNAIQIELPADKFAWYNQRPIPETIEWQGDMFNLPFKDDTLDFIYSSHLIEDFSQNDWRVMFTEWKRCLKRSGYMVILVPEVTRWAAAIARGQGPNCQHFAPEPSLGDLSRAAMAVGMGVVEERLTSIDEFDYSIMGIFRKTN